MVRDFCDALLRLKFLFTEIYQCDVDHTLVRDRLSTCSFEMRKENLRTKIANKSILLNSSPFPGIQSSTLAGILCETNLVNLTYAKKNTL